MNNVENKRPQGGLSRRAFLGQAAAAATAIAVVGAAGQGVNAAVVPDLPAYDPTQHSFLYLIDVGKCIGCGACVRACQHENDVPDHFFRTWVERYMGSRDGEEMIDSPDGGKEGFPLVVTGQEITKGYFAPKICNHCSSSPCVQLCPVGASFRSPDGVVLVDQDRCIGCSYCVQACPYGSRFIHPVKHVASKCTLCYHRTTRGMKPACVEACPVGARMLGDAKDPHDEVSRIVATQAVHVLKPELYTEPNCYYLGSDMEMR